MRLDRAALSAALLFWLALAMQILPTAARAHERADEAASRRILVMLRLPPPHFRPNAGYEGDYGDTLTRAASRRIALRIARENRLELIDGWPMPLVGVDCFVMRVPSDMSTDTAVARASRHRMVAWSEPMQLYGTRSAAHEGGDPLLAVQPAATAWNLAGLHRVATGRGVTVAVIDSKIEVGHPDLAGQFVADKDFVGNRSAAAEQHGTGIAGVIAAKADNSLGIAGIAPEARLMALRACWQADRTDAAGTDMSTICDTLTLAKALHYANEHGVQVINMSLSGPPSPLLERLIGIALARAAAVVAAFDPALPKGGFPASQPGVVAVADESLPSLPAQVYAAPGLDVPTTQPGGRWYLMRGSSYAAAHVSGLLALVREKRGGAASPMLVAARATGGTIKACSTLLRTPRSCDCSCAVARQNATAER